MSMQRRADNNKHFASFNFKQHLLLTWSVYVKRSVKNLRACFNKHCLQTTDHTLQGCQMRTKNNVYSNSIISNIYIIDEILLFDFKFAHLAHSLATAAASKCHYNVTNLAEPRSTHAVVWHVVVIFVIVTSSHTRPVAAGGGGLECDVGWSTAPASNPGTSRLAYYCVE